MGGEVYGAPKRSRTSSLQIRSLTLCPVELWAHGNVILVEKEGFEPSRPVTRTLA